MPLVNFFPEGPSLFDSFGGLPNFFCNIPDLDATLLLRAAKQGSSRISEAWTVASNSLRMKFLTSIAVRESRPESCKDLCSSYSSPPTEMRLKIF